MSVQASTVSASTDVTERMDTFRFTGSAGEYFRIWIVNMLLSIVTLGIYSAWAKVRDKQYFYRHTRLQGAGFDYHADPTRILKGRIIVGTFFGAMVLSQHYSMTLYAVFFLVFMAVMPWFAVKAFMFNARNSSYRGIRFGFCGSVGQSYMAYIVFPILAVLTLGILYPAAHHYRVRYYARNHQFGKSQFSYDVPVGRFYWLYFGTVLMGIVAYTILVVLAVGLVAIFAGGFDEPTVGAGPSFAQTAPIVLAVYLAMTIPGAYFQARMANLFYGNIKLGRHQMHSVQRFRDILWLYVSNLLAIVFSLGLAVPWAKVRMAKYRAEHMYVMFQGSLIAEADPGQRGIEAYGDAAADFGDFGFDL